MKNKKLLLLSLLFVPTMVYASNGDTNFTVGFALAMEAFVSIHMSIFVLLPLSRILSKENSKKMFWKLFAIRAGILLFCDFFITPNVAIVDFISVFAFGFAIIPLLTLVTKQNDENLFERFNVVYSPHDQKKFMSQIRGVELTCPKCDSPILLTNKFCPKCGEPINSESLVSQESNETIQNEAKVVVLPSNFDSMYSLSEDNLLGEFIDKELVKANIDKYSRLIPRDILRRKKILNFIFSVLLFVYVSLIFFHFPIYIYIIGFFILIVFFSFTKNYTLISYLKKEVKSRPSEKISDIVMNVKNNFVMDNSRSVFAISLILAIGVPLFIFSSPRIIYEKTDGGYAVRFYTFGLTNFKTASIPETYNNEKVVTLRGNTFSNMPLLESVNLPDSITEIRGQAFKNCYKLRNINIPKNLEYLGGGAFYNARSITKIELPDTLTYLGGESFYGASSLESIKLSNNLTEIRGDTFEYCTSLMSINIPDNVTRIGGHAFYGDTLLSTVNISENSYLLEIGSSAFRECPSLLKIYIPIFTVVNERSFKDSPTMVIRYDNSKPNNYSYDYDNEYNYYYNQ